MNRKKILLAMALASGMFLVGCSAETSATAEVPATQSPSISAILAGAKGFTVGAPLSARTTYIFFDAQCSHCAHLWEASKPLWDKMKFTWIPVAYLGKASTSQGAAILSAVNPGEAMAEHETLMLAKKGGISAGAPTAESTAAIDKNTKLLTSFGASSIPYIVAVDGAGKLISVAGSLATPELAKLLGLPWNPVQASPRP